MVTDRPAMTIAVDLGCKATKQTIKCCPLSMNPVCDQLILLYGLVIYSFSQIFTLIINSIMVGSDQSVSALNLFNLVPMIE